MQLNDRPATLVLTRQNLPTLDRERFASAAGVARGGYVLADAANGSPEVILIGTGSELSLCVGAHEQLTADGIAARVVSLPCWELFEDQDAAYRESVLPAQVTARVAAEAGVRQGWDAYIGQCGRFVGMSGFGASGPAGELMQHFGLTVENVVAQAKAALGK
jgi:transketolase